MADESAAQRQVNAKPGDIVRLKSGGVEMTMQCINDDGDVVAVFNNGGTVMSTTCDPALLVRIVEEPLLPPAPDLKEKPKKKVKGGPRKLRDPEPGSFADKVRTLVDAGQPIEVIAVETGRSVKVVQMWIGRLRISGFLPKE